MNNSISWHQNVPCIAGTGIFVEFVADRFRSGESIESLADDYNLTNEQITNALRYQLRTPARRKLMETKP